MKYIRGFLVILTTLFVPIVTAQSAYGQVTFNEKLLSLTDSIRQLFQTTDQSLTGRMTTAPTPTSAKPATGIVTGADSTKHQLKRKHPKHRHSLSVSTSTSRAHATGKVHAHTPHTIHDRQIQTLYREFEVWKMIFHPERLE
jgi:hypothetical protein